MRRLRNKVLDTSPFRTSCLRRSCEGWDPILEPKVRRSDRTLLTVLLSVGLTLAAPFAVAVGAESGLRAGRCASTLN